MALPPELTPGRPCGVWETKASRGETREGGKPLPADRLDGLTTPADPLVW